jgi:hypothetical protein
MVAQGRDSQRQDSREEFGLTQEEIIQAIRKRQLQYRVNSVYGNPFLRLLRREVEALVEKQRGGAYLKDRRIKAEVTRISRELQRLRMQIAALEQRKRTLAAGMGT